jgi:hypothetical protein
MKFTTKVRPHYKAIEAVGCASLDKVKSSGMPWAGLLAVTLFLLSAMGDAAAFDPCDTYAGPVFSSAAVRAGELQPGDYILWFADGIPYGHSDSCDTWS